MTTPFVLTPEPATDNVDWAAVCRTLPKATLADLLTAHATRQTSGNDTTRQLRLAAVTHGVLNPIEALHDAADDLQHQPIHHSHGAQVRGGSAWGQHLRELLDHTCDPDNHPRQTLQLAATAIDVALDNIELVDDSYGDVGWAVCTAVQHMAAAIVALHTSGNLEAEVHRQVEEFLDVRVRGDEYGLMVQPQFREPMQQMEDVGLGMPSEELMSF